jgi:threonine-phosphate decarboxylase
MIIPDRTRNRIKLDFTRNTNPIGIPDVSKTALSDVDCIEKERDCSALTRLLAVREKTGERNILCGNGAEDLVYRLVESLHPERAIVCEPSFGAYKRALLENKCSVQEYQLSPEDGFVLTAEFADLINNDTDMVFLCSPNEPTGALITPYTLAAISEKCRECNTILVCDESFMDIAVKDRKYSAKSLSGYHIIVLQSMSITYSMGGLNLAYAVFAADKIADLVRRSGRKYNVCGTAQAAGAAALSDVDYLRRSRSYIADERKYLMDNLTSMGIMVFPSQANFLLIRCSRPIGEMLLRRGMLIHNCKDDAGLGEEYYCIYVRTHAENVKLINEIEHILHV